MMRKINKIQLKNLGMIVPIICLSLFNSCNDDLLDTKPLGQATGDELAVGGQEAAVFGLYGQFRTTAVGDWQRYWFGSIRSDDAAKGSSTTDAAEFGNVFNDFQYVATNGLNTSWWDDHYKMIYACNEIINNIAEIEDPSTETLINDAEARAIRAFLYFELRRDYGEVPIVTITVENPSDAIKAKSPVTEVDAFIKQDLESAIEQLPASWSSDFTGRATKAFAQTMLAKLYLYQGDWNNALTICRDQIIGSGLYSLDPDLKNLFEIGGNNGVESIFEIQQLVTEAATYASNYFGSQGVRGSGEWDLGWGFNVPTPELIAAFEPGDLRKNVTILTSGEDDGGYGGGILPTSPPLDQMYWNKKAYTEKTHRNNFNQLYNRWENIKLLRYADVILMAAEAANELGQTGTAAGYVNQIRNRAGLANTTAAGQADLRDAIKHERRVEFALENERFYDLVRWGDATTVLAGLGYQPKNALFPIPQTAIDQAGGVLIQNPNY